MRSAVKSQKKAILKYLIEQKCNLDESNDNYSPAIFVAANANLVEMAEILLKNGADPTVLHKDQTVLLYATKTEQLEMFKLLLKHGAPVCSYEPGIPPLINALKAQNTEAVALLLQHGADPNCTQASKNNTVVRPLDIAIRNKSSSATTLLIIAGANIDTLNKSEIDPKICKQIEKYKTVNPQRKTEESYFSNELNSLVQQFSVIDGSSQRLIETLQDAETNPRAEITPLINKIREMFVKFSEYIPLVVDFESRLSEKRLALLKKQLKIFELNDRQVLAPELSDDIRKWREFFPRTMELLEKNKNKSQQKNSFIDFCIAEMKKRAEEIADTENRILDFGDDDGSFTEDPDEECIENRIALVEYNEIVQQLRFHISHIDDSLAALGEESILLVEASIEKIRSIYEKLGKLNTSKEMFTRAGLLPAMITEIQESIAPKQAIVNESMKQLLDNRESFREMTDLLQKLLRRHVK